VRYDFSGESVGMTCAACAARLRLEKVLNRLPGVEAKVNFGTGKARVMALPDAPPAADMVAAIRKAGFDVAPRCSNWVCRHELRRLRGTHRERW
jgi:cation transport ATPase